MMTVRVRGSGASEPASLAELRGSEFLKCAVGQGPVLSTAVLAVAVSCGIIGGGCWGD